MKTLLHFLNPIAWFHAWIYAQQSAKFDKSTFDLELYLYSKILSNNMLHYGYFENTAVAPATISLQQLEDAQVKYAQNIIDEIKDTQNTVLDIGCGMGGLSSMIMDKKISVECLTPNKNQVDFIRHTFPMLNCHPCKFEDLQTDKKYGTLINSESIQYISLDKAFEQADKLAMPNTRWIIVDYFRKNNDGINKSSHLLADFLQKIESSKWQLVLQRDITQNVLPTLRFANMYAERFLMPIKHFGYEKLRFKKPALYYMTSGMSEKIEQKITKEKASIDPIKFENEKQYMFFVLERKAN